MDFAEGQSWLETDISEVRTACFLYDLCFVQSGCASQMKSWQRHEDSLEDFGFVTGEMLQASSGDEEL